MNELKPIPSFPGYSITRGGRIWSERSNRWMSTHISGHLGGREITGLRQGGHQRIVAIHRLLLETFVGPCPEGMECRHLDGNRLNNSLENLCWDTHFRNNQDKVLHGTAGRGGRKRKLTDQQVAEVRRQLRGGVRQRRLAARFGVSQMAISNINTHKVGI